MQLLATDHAAAKGTVLLYAFPAPVPAKSCMCSRAAEQQHQDGRASGTCLVRALYVGQAASWHSGEQYLHQQDMHKTGNTLCVLETSDQPAQ
jgi:hypothetical protein